MKWIYNDGSEKELSDMSQDELNAVLKTVNKRQIHAINKLKKSQELEKAILAEAKKRKITIESLELSENPWYSKQYAQKKEVIVTVTNSLIRKEKKLNG